MSVKCLPVRSRSTSGRPSTTSVNFVTITRRGSFGTAQTVDQLLHKIYVS